MAQLFLVCPQTTSQRTLTDLPTIVALQICDYLDAVDLINLCTAVPKWKAFLTRRRFAHVMKQHMMQWTWFDKRLFQLLLPHSFNTCVESTCEAIIYRNALVKCFQLFCDAMAQQKQYQSHENLRYTGFSFLSSNYASNRVGDYYHQPLCITWTKKFSFSGRFYIPSDSGKQQFITYAINRQQYCLQCTAYVITSISGQILDVITELKAHSPNDMVSIIFVMNEEENVFSLWDRLQIFSSFFTVLPVEWRIWCTRRCAGEDFDKWDEYVDWTCYDMISKSIKNGQGNMDPETKRENN
ncbi:unnamed protein product [Hydatigera taeniaeformis]|uniref:F-box domain-containing protein n=1 Tax=Hydatigena taeniaeformis TaxID=6205 RepID=A0A0R3WJ39_HYDTA|nr:unnamed protein product [Hydatigera taeniaeformis]